MMSPENIPPPPENDAATRKTTPQKPPHEQPQKCPRCDSANTKFCYYNNYSLTQPRHFCKTCRRYWTRGGALRNVPIGGGCRKTKKLRTNSSSSTTTSNSSSTTAKIGVGGVEFGHGFKFLSPNLNPSSLGCTTPAAGGMEFQLGGFSLPKLHPATAGVYTQYVTSSVPPPGHGTGAGPYFGLDLLAGLNYSASSPPPPQPPSGNENPISISSIESLSSINQEMHWKLQQQRLAMIYGRGDDREEHKISDQEKLHHQDTHQGGGSINLFKNLEINNNNNNVGERKMNVGPTEWLFDQIQTSSAANHGNYGTNCTSNNVNEVAGSNLHGVWGDLNHHNHHQQQLQFHGLE